MAMHPDEVLPRLPQYNRVQYESRTMDDFADHLLSIWTHLSEQHKVGAIGDSYSITSDFKEIVSKARPAPTQKGPEKGTPRKATPPHPNGPAPMDESIYMISAQQREPTQREVQEFSLFSKMVYPFESQ